MSTPRLRKDLSLFSLFTLAFGTIVGVGWVTVLGAWLLQAGAIGAVVAFLVGGVLMAVIGLCYSEVASMFPRAGGEVEYITRMYGPRFAFLGGWFLAFNYIAVTTFEAISVGWVVENLVPDFQDLTLYTVMDSDVKALSLSLGVGIMALITVANYLGARGAALLQNGCTALFLLASGLFVIFGFGNGRVDNLMPAFAGTGMLAGGLGILAVLATAPFWFAGFDVVPQAMEELRDDVPTSRVARVIVAAIAAAALFYALVIVTAAMSLPRDELLSHEMPLVGALSSVFVSPWLGDMVLVAALFGLITTWNAIFFAATRVLFAMGQFGMIPTWFGAVHPRYGAPANAALFVGVVGALGAFAGRSAILIIVGLSALILSAIFLAVVLGAARLRRTDPHRPRPFRMPFGQLGLRCAAAAAALVFLLAVSEPLRREPMALPVEWLMILVWGALGALLYRQEHERVETHG